MGIRIPPGGARGSAGLRSGALAESLVGVESLIGHPAESLVGVESLIGHPASMMDASVPKAMREGTGLTDSLVRLSWGIEDTDDLIADLDQAFAASGSRRPVAVGSGK